MSIQPTPYNPGPGKLIITIEGGLVQNIEGGPDDLSVEVWDFDTEGEDDTRLDLNAEGESFFRQLWKDGT